MPTHLTENDIPKIKTQTKIEIYRELIKVFQGEDKDVIRKLKKALREAEADQIAENDPEAANVHRNLEPEF